MPAKYVLSQKSSGYHWNLLATNGRVIASSEVYNSKAAAMAGIRSVQKNGPTDVIVTDQELKASRSPAKKSPVKAAKKATSKGTDAATSKGTTAVMKATTVRAKTK